MSAAEPENLRQFLKGPIGLDDFELDVLQEELNMVRKEVLAELDRRYAESESESLEDES